MQKMEINVSDVVYACPDCRKKYLVRWRNVCVYIYTTFILFKQM